MNTRQMELSLSSERRVTFRSRRERRIPRATWWFNRMREIVDNAMDWPAAPEPRPEQTWIPGTQRQVQL